jgi:hypothetical protein
MSQTEPKAEWLYSRNGKTFGPLTAGQLRQLVSDQRLGPKDLVCRDGTNRWVAAGSLKGLFPAAATPVETVEQVVVQPKEADRPANTDREDSQWRMFAGRFLVVNLVACGLIGLIKPPPAHIAAYNEAMRGLRKLNTDLKESLDETTRRMREDLEEKKRELERENRN